MNPICIKCQIELRPKNIGVVAVAMATFGPYEIRRADIWSCPSCGLEILEGMSIEPELTHHSPAFTSRLESYDMDSREIVRRYWKNAAEKTATLRAQDEKQSAMLNGNLKNIWTQSTKK